MRFNPNALFLIIFVCGSKYTSYESVNDSRREDGIRCGTYLTMMEAVGCSQEPDLCKEEQYQQRNVRHVSVYYTTTPSTMKFPAP